MSLDLTFEVVTVGPDPLLTSRSRYAPILAATQELEAGEWIRIPVEDSVASAVRVGLQTTAKKYGIDIVATVGRDEDGELCVWVGLPEDEEVEE